MSEPINSTGEDNNPFWRRWIPGTNASEENSQDTPTNSSSEHQDEGWLKRYIPAWFSNQESLEISDSTSYYQLTKKQIKILENEAGQGILKGHDTCCWFNETLNNKLLDSDGVLSVYNTGSATCPLPLSKYPLLPQRKSTIINAKNSTIIPGVSPTEYMHELPLKTKLAHAIKNHYNFISEKHLYLKQHSTLNFNEDTIIVISLHGSLPEKYERVSTGKLPTALELNDQMLKKLLNFDPHRALTFSFECPLDVKPTPMVLQETISLLKNWMHLFQDATRIFVIGTYHSVPLSILLTDAILDNFTITKLKSIGILGFESCLQGYQFWNHTAEITPQSMENPTFQVNKEKALFEGSSKLQQEVLSTYRNYRNPDGPERKELMNVLDKLLFHHPNLRISLVGKLYDNFLTVSQKLAMDYIHPMIQRRLWCDGNNMNLNYINVAKAIPDETMINLEQSFKIPIPEEREFEVSIMNNMLLAINLGHRQFIPFLNELSPFYISRSFNSSTCPALLKKQLQTESKAWQQEKDASFKEMVTDSEKILPKDITTYRVAFDYLHYKSHRSPDDIELKTSIFNDISILEGFIYDNIFTANLQAPVHLMMHHSSDNSKVLNSVNEYNLVWNFHEVMSSFIRIRNFPTLPGPPVITACMETPNSQSQRIEITKAIFDNTNLESCKRMEQLWRTYQTWNPNTTGLKKLHNILSVLRLYDSGEQLQKDVSIV